MDFRRAVPNSAAAPKKLYLFPVFISLLIIINGIFNFTTVTAVFMVTALIMALVSFTMTFSVKYSGGAALTDSVSVAVFCRYLFLCISSIWAINCAAAFFSIVGYCGAFFLFLTVRAYTRNRADKREAVARAVGYAGALISLLSIEMASTGILEILYFGPLSGFFGITEQTAKFGLWVEGGRMQSLMGLPNIYATFSGMCFFLSLWLVLGIKRKKPDIFDLTAVIINGTGFLLAGSRGGIFAIIMAAIVFIIYCPKNERRTMAAECITLFMWCAVTYFAVFKLMGTGSPAVWLIILISVNICSYIRPALLNAFDRLKTAGLRIFSAFTVLAVLACVCVILSLRGSGAELWAEPNVRQRLMYWRDGIRLFLQRPVTGQGGGTFETLAGSVADSYYVSRHTHNHYIQILLENGIIGFVIVLLICFFAFYALWRNRRELERGAAPCLAAAVSMALFHSFVEASMYNLLNLFVLYIIFGLISGACAGERRFNRAEPSKTLLCLCALFSAALLAGGFVTERYVRAAESEGGERALAAYRLAVVTDPLNASGYKAACLVRYAAEPNPAIAALAGRFAGELERNLNTPKDCFAVARYYLKTGSMEKAVWYFERYIELCRVNPTVWNEVLAQYYRVLQSDGDTETYISDSCKRLKQFLDDLNGRIPSPVTPDAALMRILEIQ